MKKSPWLAYLFVKTRANLNSEMSRNYLSYAWWLLEPVLFIAVLYLVFGLMLRRGDEQFIYYLSVGVTFWLWFANVVSHSVLSIVGAGPLITQVYIPKVILPLLVICVDSFKQMLVVAILLLFLFFAGFFSITWLALLPVLLVQLTVVVAASLWVAAIIPFIPDLRFVVTMVLSLLMFCSGIFYDLSVIAADHYSLMMFNPIANLMVQYRSVLLYDQWPDWLSLAKVAATSLFVSALALVFIRHYERYFPRLAIQ